MVLNQNEEGFQQFQTKYCIDVPEALLLEALTHASLREHDKTIRSNEQLETLGDAVLDLLVGHLLIRENPSIESGELTQLRSALVNNKTLSKLGEEIGISLLLKTTEGYKISKRDIANAVEAVFGAVFMHSGFEAAENLFDQIKNQLSDIAKYRTQGTIQYFNPIGKLQEFTQKRKISLPIYEIVDQAGPDHDPVFRIKCKLDIDKNYIEKFGTGKSKKSAREDAAKKILIALSQLGLVN